MVEMLNTDHLSQFEWINEPKKWGLDEGGLWLEVEEDTDFWQRTHYGFCKDSGHLLACPIRANFVLVTHVAWSPQAQYDQAGLMVRLSETCWLKSSVEFAQEGPDKLGVVVTNQGFSDWSMQPYEKEPNLWFRLQGLDGDYTVEWRSAETAPWELLRLSHFTGDPGHFPLLAGVYGCSPKGRGFRVNFLSLRLSVSPES